MVAISKHLLGELDRLTATERTRAEDFLGAEPDAPVTRADLEARVAKLERRLGSEEDVRAAAVRAGLGFDDVPDTAAYE